jgi:hypothetical protein
MMTATPKADWKTKLKQTGGELWLQFRFAVKRIRALAAGREPPSAWDTALDVIDDWICVIDIYGRIMKSNAVVFKKFNIPAVKAEQMSCCRLLHGTLSPVDGCPLSRMLISRKRETAELELQDGRWMLISVDPVFDSKGDICQAVHICRDITPRIRIQNERTKLLWKLKQALTQVKTLKGLIPICACCKKIRDDKGFWNLIESYIESHSEALFSHGMCPDCMDKYYGTESWYWEMKNKKKNKGIPDDNKNTQ